MKKDAFSLIEVNMALLVVSLGLAALLGLFPVALRESGLATSDTTQALFATRILNAIQANAGAIKTWDQWTDPDEFVDEIDIDEAPIKADGVKHNIKDAYENIVCYQLTLGYVDGTDERLRYAAIRVANNEYSDISKSPVYYTEFRYGCN